MPSSPMSTYSVYFWLHRVGKTGGKGWEWVLGVGWVVFNRVGVGGWYKIGVGMVWVDGWKREGVVVPVDMQPCMDAYFF